jgi:hypothetical protein
MMRCSWRYVHGAVPGAVPGAIHDAIHGAIKASGSAPFKGWDSPSANDVDY